MPKPEILDPQGKAVTGALNRLGFAGVSVRQGKRFELELEGGADRRAMAAVRTPPSAAAKPVMRLRVRSSPTLNRPRVASQRSRRPCADEPAGRRTGRADTASDEAAGPAAHDDRRIGVVTFPGSRKTKTR